MPERAQTPSDPGTAFYLGKIEGQLRELIHNLNNEAMKNTARDEKLSKLESVPGDVADIKVRLTALETDKHRRDGAVGFGSWILRSPLIGWLVGFGLALWAFLRGHGQ